MAEEFDESEVLFSDSFSSVLEQESEDENRQFDFDEVRDNETRRIKRRTKDKALSSSLPVIIPENMFRRYVGKDEEEYSEVGGVIVPPHIIVGQRINGGGGGKMAYSVCSGNGRTLKGRDLSQVRNSVLRLTGFLEV